MDTFYQPLLVLYVMKNVQVAMVIRLFLVLDVNLVAFYKELNVKTNAQVLSMVITYLLLILNVKHVMINVYFVMEIKYLNVLHV